MYSSRYRDPGAVARRQVALVARWGRRLAPGARLSELGCADGFVTEALVRAGFRVTAVDLSSGMIEVARRRLAAAGLDARLLVADVNAPPIAGPFDAVLAIMWTFFHYVHDPVGVLAALGSVSSKVIVDVNPRRTPLGQARAAVGAGGFYDVRWRPFAVPQRVRLPRPALAALRLAEAVPGVRAVPLRWKFNAVILGQRR